MQDRRRKRNEEERRKGRRGGSPGERHGTRTWFALRGVLKGMTCGIGKNCEKVRSHHLSTYLSTYGRSSPFINPSFKSLHIRPVGQFSQYSSLRNSPRRLGRCSRAEVRLRIAHRLLYAAFIRKIRPKSNWKRSK